MQGKFWLSGFAILLLGACAAFRPAPDFSGLGPVSYEPYTATGVQQPDELTFKRTYRYDYQNYVPDTNQLGLLPLRTVRVNFHIMNSADTLYDFYGDQAGQYIWQLVTHVNDKLANNPENWLNPDSMEVPALPTRLRIQIATDPVTKQLAVYEHYDDKHYAYLHTGPKRNRADQAVLKKYKIREDSELNIFFMGPPRDSLDSPTFRRSSSSGILVGNAIKLTDNLSQWVQPWDFRGVLTHEIGHALGLGHAWVRNDGCDDTPRHANDAWSAKEQGPGKTTNNVMDYGPVQVAFTPCQIGRVHARISDPASRQRGWLVEDWCEYRPGDSLVIEVDTELLGGRDFNSDIIIRPGVRLLLDARVHLAERARILVQPGATLELGPKAILHNDCGGTWGGIHVGQARRFSPGLVVSDSLATVINVAQR